MAVSVDELNLRPFSWRKTRAEMIGVIASCKDGTVYVTFPGMYTWRSNIGELQSVALTSGMRVQVLASRQKYLVMIAYESCDLDTESKRGHGGSCAEHQQRLRANHGE